jgi:hypothetical protein
MLSRLTSFLARYWFPIALGVLFLLALPGLLLLALDLFGLESATSSWLQENFNVTYSVGIPWFASLLLLLLPLLILLLYFLKLKRKPLQVPSTFLWRKSIEDLHVNSLLQWLRQNVLLLLQLLVVMVLIYGVLNLRVHGRTGKGKHYILMIDNSASMSANDVKPNRLEWARQEALKEIDAAGDDDFGMVLEFNSSAKTVQSRTSDRELLRQAVKSIQPTQRPTNIAEALRLAASLANPYRSTENEASRPEGDRPGMELTYAPVEGTPTEVHIYSDGRFPDVEDFKLGNLKPQFHAAGVPGRENVRNVGIVGASVERDEKEPTKLQVFASLHNYCPFGVSARVELTVAVEGRRDVRPDQQVQLKSRIVLEPKEGDKEPVPYSDEPGEGSAVFELRDLDEATEVLLHLRILEVRDDNGQLVTDTFPLDDQVWLVVGVVRKARVLIVTKGNDVLRSFFDGKSARAVAQVEYLTPAELETEKYLKPALNGTYDLVVFDRCGPAKESDMPRANTFFVGYPPPPWQLAGDGKEGHAVEKLEGPRIKGWMNRHSIMADLRALHEIGIDQAFKMKDLPPRTPRLMEAGNDTPLLLTLNRQAFTDLVMTFPIFTAEDKYNTDWPVRHTSFPLFLANVLYALGNVSDSATEPNVQPGQVKPILPDVSIDEIQVTAPDGSKQTLHRGTRPEFSYGGTERVGIYQISWDGAVQRRFAVNLLDGDESNLQPRTTLNLGDEKIEAGTVPGQPRELWRWVVLAALLLLLLEWYVYNRRVYI